MNGKKPTGANWGTLDSVSARASSDPLASVRKVAEAMAGLRSGTGRLDAGRVAEAFGLSLAELAGLVGKGRTSLSRTPDAMVLQPSLRPFERTVRLRAVLSEADFLSWLNLSSPRLESQTPIDVIRAGRADVVANLVEDLLTGAPG